MSSLSPQPFGACPLCASALKGQAQLPTRDGGVDRMYMCPDCGQFLVRAPLGLALLRLPAETRRALGRVVRAATLRPHIMTSADVANAVQQA